MSKRSLRFIAFSLVWLLVGLGCKKEEPEPLCETEGCCEPNIATRVAATLKGVLINPLSLDRPYITVRDRVYDKRLFNNQQSQITYLELCAGEEEKLNVFIRQQQQLPDYKPEQEYKLWGWVYDAIWISPTFPGLPIYAIKIDRIEKAP